MGAKRWQTSAVSVCFLTGLYKSRHTRARENHSLGTAPSRARVTQHSPSVRDESLWFSQKGNSMPDGVNRPDAEAERDFKAKQTQLVISGEAMAARPSAASAQDGRAERAVGEQSGVSGSPIIWTTGFILAFALILVGGVSLESVLSQAWANGVLPSVALLLQIHVLLSALGWLLLGLKTHSNWTRVGSLFGVISAGFMTLNIVLILQNMSISSPLQSYNNVATCVALLGAYSGISIGSAVLTRWDSWLFLLTPLLIVLGAILLYAVTSQASVMTTENAVAAAALIACILFWAGRPSCWKKQPGPTFLFSVVPLILLSAALANNSMHNFFLFQIIYATLSARSNVNNCFFAQLVQLGLFLGCLRLTKSETGFSLFASLPRLLKK